MWKPDIWVSPPGQWEGAHRSFLCFPNSSWAPGANLHLVFQRLKLRGFFVFFVFLHKLDPKRPTIGKATLAVVCCTSRALWKEL